MLSGNYCTTTATDFVISYGFANAGYVYSVPVNGFTLLIPNNVYDVIINPATALLSGTIQLPTTTQDGKSVEIVTMKPITLMAVTCAAGDTILGSVLTSMLLSSVAVYKYILPIKTWIRKQ